MVQKTALRIGNLLKRNASFNHFFFVQAITETAIYFDSGEVLTFDQIEPVWLTPELLFKAGFVFGRKFCGSDFFDLKQKHDFSGNEIWEFKRNNEPLAEIQYVHQLQNLYFALSGNELKIVV